MFDGKMLDGIGNFIIGSIVVSLVLGGLIVGGIWWLVSSGDDEVITDEKIQPKEIIIRVNPETGVQDTTYVY